MQQNRKRLYHAFFFLVITSGLHWPRCNLTTDRSSTTTINFTHLFLLKGKKMETDRVNYSPARSPPLRDELRHASQHSFYLSPPPLYIKPPKFSPPRYPSISPTRDTYSAFSPPAFFPMLGPGYSQKEGSQKRKRTPFKMDAPEGESPDGAAEEAEEGSRKKTVDLAHFPFSFPHRPMPSPSPKPMPGMIELNRLQLHHRSPGMSLPVQVKQEPLSPSPVWPPSPLLLHPPYFPTLHHSLLPYPFFMPGPVMHLSPGSFYPREDLHPRHRGREGPPRSGTTSAEKLGLNVHVDDSYYVDVGGDQKRWKCRMCEKSYTSKYNLVTHILGHNGIKPHGCHLCGKLFKQLSHLHTHLLTHQGMRPHKCTVCHKAFTQTSHLKRHMMQHSDVKPYRYMICFWLLVVLSCPVFILILHFIWSLQLQRVRQRFCLPQWTSRPWAEARERPGERMCGVWSGFPHAGPTEKAPDRPPWPHPVQVSTKTHCPSARISKY